MIGSSGASVPTPSIAYFSMEVGVDIGMLTYGSGLGVYWRETPCMPRRRFVRTCGWNNAIAL